MTKTLSSHYFLSRQEKDRFLAFSTVVSVKCRENYRKRILVPVGQVMSDLLWKAVFIRVITETFRQNFKACNNCVIDLSWEDTDIKDCHEEVRYDSYTVSLPFFWFCSGPVQSIQDVLTKGRKETIRHLQENNNILNSNSMSNTSFSDEGCVNMYLQHVVDDVEFDHRLSSDQMVHHGIIHVMHHGETQHQDQSLQNITHLCWLQQTGPTENGIVVIIVWQIFTGLRFHLHTWLTCCNTQCNMSECNMHAIKKHVVLLPWRKVKCSSLNVNQQDEK